MILSRCSIFSNVICRDYQRSMITPSSSCATPLSSRLRPDDCHLFSTLRHFVSRSGRQCGYRRMLGRRNISTVADESEKEIKKISEISHNYTTKWNIILEDDDYLILNKPSGVPVTGVQANEGSLHRDMLKMLGGSEFRPQLLTPLEKRCSGIMVYGKHRAAENHFLTYYDKSLSNFSSPPLSSKSNIFTPPSVSPKHTDWKMMESQIERQSQLQSKYSESRKRNGEREYSTEYPPDFSHYYLWLGKGKLLQRRGRIQAGIITKKGGGRGVRRPVLVRRGGSFASLTFLKLQALYLNELKRKGGEVTPFFTKLSLVGVQNHTPSQHQMRACASSFNTPIVGDVLYGGGKPLSLPLSPQTITDTPLRDTTVLHEYSPASIFNNNKKNEDKGITCIHSFFIRFPKFLQKGHYEIICQPAHWNIEIEDSSLNTMKDVLNAPQRLVPIGGQRAQKKEQSKVPENDNNFTGIDEDDLWKV